MDDESDYRDDRRDETSDRGRRSLSRSDADADREHRDNGHGHSRRRDDDRDDDRGHGRGRHERRHRDDRDRSRSPRKHHSRSRDRSRSPERERSRRDEDDLYRPDDRRDRDRDRDRDHGGRSDRRSSFSSRGRGGGGGNGTGGGPMNATPEEAEAHARISKRGNRLYVGNLSYDCTYRDLSRFMSGAGGDVVFSEVLVTPAGMSKGCGIVEFATNDQARRAKAELADRPFMGRSVFIREDREETARFGAAPIPGKMGIANGEARTFLGNPGAAGNRHVFVGNVPFQASWQDLKDLMRQAGEVIRADVGSTADGRPKGNGTVVFADPESARGAIQMFNGYDWFGNILEVREDRFANMPFRGRGGFRGTPAFARGGGFGMRGGMRGGFGGGGGFGGAGMGMGGGMMGGGMGMGIGGGMGGMMGVNGGGGYHNGAAAAGNGYGYAVAQDTVPVPATPKGSGLRPEPAEPSAQIWVRNLPWSTTNEDLVELFETVGNVVLAEIIYEGERSKGEGIVQFTETQEAQSAGDRFMAYMYGNRPLDVQFNPSWHEFGAGAARGGPPEIAGE